MAAETTLSEGSTLSEGARPRALEVGEVAWLVVIPCALVAVVAILVLGPPLGRAFFAPTGARFWSEMEVWPEPVEHARFVLALLAVPVAVIAILVGVRRPARLRPALARSLVAASRAATVGFVALALLAQHEILLSARQPPLAPAHIFTVRTLVVAAAFVLAVVLLLRSERALARLHLLARETRARRIVCLALAGLLAAAWLSSAFNTDTTIGAALGNHLIPWDMSEAFAVLNGRTPLVDYHTQYAHLLPFPTAALMALVGDSEASWTVIMLLASGCALLAVYAMLRRLIGSSLLALLLFLPLLAGGFFLITGTPENRFSPAGIFSLWPMRYGGPYLLAWLTVRHLDDLVPRRRWLLLIVASLVALNNLEFGLPALGGTLAALVWVAPPRSPRAALRLARDVGIGILAAVVLVSTVTLAHAGELPHFELMLEFPRLYGMNGWVLWTMPTMGLHLALYATFVAAIAVATVRAVRDEPNRLLTGALAWSGIFGLGASSYYAGRSEPLNLVSMFSAWFLALALLTIVVVGALAARGARRPTAAALAVLFGIALAACSVPQLPLPWSQLERLQHRGPPIFEQPAAVSFVDALTTKGERVGIFIPLGHRVAHDAGVVNVAPYSGIESIPTAEQLETALGAMHRERVTRVFIDRRYIFGEQADALVAAGWQPVDEEEGYVLLIPAAAITR